MQFIMGETYTFNLLIKGVVYGIQCIYEGNGENIEGTKVAHFVRIKGDGSRGHIFKWTYEDAVAHSPEMWAEPLEVFNAQS